MAVAKLDKSGTKAVQIDLEIVINAPIKKVCRTMVINTTVWRPRDFHTSPDTKQFKIEPKLGGRNYEEIGHGTGLV
jgi:hypothetical protein